MALIGHKIKDLLISDPIGLMGRYLTLESSSEMLDVIHSRRISEFPKHKQLI